MLLEQQIKEVFQYQKEYLKKLSNGTPRTLLNEVDISDFHVKIVTGIRRSGKSTLLLQLLDKGNFHNFLSFEDPRLAQFEVNDFFKLERIFKEFSDSEVYFFDEIQNIEGWERFIRILHDKKIRVVISGSNASLLSKELGTSLTGRQITYELFPFSYNEYLIHKEKNEGINSFEEYLELGGFPEYLNSNNRNVLIQLFNDLIYQDIIVRHGLRNAKVIKELGVYLATNIGKEFSYSKLAKTFELGSVNTALSYISYFEDAYLFFTVPRFSYSLKKQAKNQKKIYGIDSGLVSNLSLSFSKDKGRLLENMVFIELKRRSKDVYYFRNRGECDFVVSKNQKLENLIQVCYELNHDNLQRELNGILEAMGELKINSGIILTMNHDDEIVKNDKKIIIKPVWKWMLENTKTKP
ncbi:MAG: ATP-binding protein [Bacteroidales bacterium]|nr:ATP-binding protein [Bacteroidales bacterium]